MTNPDTGEDNASFPPPAVPDNASFVERLKQDLAAATARIAELEHAHPAVVQAVETAAEDVAGLILPEGISPWLADVLNALHTRVTKLEGH